MHGTLQSYLDSEKFALRPFPLEKTAEKDSQSETSENPTPSSWFRFEDFAS
jgi:hypothetical protein